MINFVKFPLIEQFRIYEPGFDNLYQSLSNIEIKQDTRYIILVKNKR